MSREAELYRDKIEVSLDGRQIFYLFFGGAVIVGLVFVLGVMVGRRVEARGHVERAHTAATVDPLAALDRLEAGGGLSFQGSLRGHETPPSDVEKKIDAMAKAKVEEKKAEPKKAEKIVEEKKAEPKKAEEKKLEEKKAEEKKKVDEKSDSESPKSEVRSPKSDSSSKPDADAPKKTRYTLQLSSFQDKSEAQAFLDSAKASGYQAYLTEGEVDGKQYFRIRLGSYKSLDAANDAKSEYDKSAKKSAVVIKL